MKTITCNYCGSYDHLTVNHGPDLLLNRPGNYTLVRCLYCGLIYQNPQLTLEEMSDHYPDNYDPFREDIRTDTSLIRRIDASYGLQRRRRLFMKYASRQGRILDVGCATGLFLNAMSNHGWQVTGVELSPYAAAYAQRVFKLKVIVGALEAARFPDTYFDAVTLWDTLEHVIDPKGTLSEIYRILQPGGMLALSLPNPISWEASIFGNGWVGWDRPRHLHLFTPAVLRRYLKEAGFINLKTKSLGGRLGLTLMSLEMLFNSRNMPLEKWGPRIKMINNWPVRALTLPLYWLAEHLNRSNIFNVFVYKPQ